MRPKQKMDWFWKIFIASSLLLIFWIYRPHFQLEKHEKMVMEEFIPDECKCVDSLGIAHNFCYSMGDLKGKKFDCGHVESLRNLGVLGGGHDTISPLDLSHDEFPAPVMVSAWSSNHHHEGIRLLRSIRSRWPSHKVIVYDLGLTELEAEFLKALCNVELRKFDFSSYPSYVSKLMEYRWKPLIYAEVLQQYGAAWWLDSSIVFKKNTMEHVYGLLKCRSKVSTPGVIPSESVRDERENKTKHEDGWDQRIWRENIWQCNKSPLLLHGWTGHGIYPVTGKFMYDFIPTHTEKLFKFKAKMYDATIMFAVRTSDAVDDILKWWVLCALEDNCMSNHNIGVVCFMGDRFKSEPACHRFDQSAVNLLLANSRHFDRKYYVSEIVDFFKIIRGAGGESSADDANLEHLTCKE